MLSIQKNIPLKDWTTFKIGGPARYFTIVKTKEELIKAISKAEELEVPFFILGGGSNILVSDEGFEGLIIKMENVRILELENDCLNLDSGVLMSDIGKACAKSGLYGFEWAAGIPGTVGGAIRGNAAAFDSAMSDILLSVEALDSKTGDVFHFANKDCGFSNKDSVFKQNGLVIISCVLKFKKGDMELIRKKVEENIRYRKEKHPLDFPSAGCIFKNPEGRSAGLLVYQCGLSGTKKGQAQISDKHSNFIINLGGASAEDVLSLVNLMQKKVKEKFNITLEQEIQRVGF